jgi:hypothetical protein
LVTSMLRLVALVGVVARASAQAGVWLDPFWFENDTVTTGLRFMAGGAGHYRGDLTLLGTNDGAHWFTLYGRSELGRILVDFQPVGGETRTATWVADGTLHWSDGNLWSSYAPYPTPGALKDYGYAYPVGFFKDPHHFKEQSHSFVGVRIISEWPAKVWTIIGSDDGNPFHFWNVTGNSIDTGDRLSEIHFDFSPKGGPADLVGKWDPVARTITWPDGNVWSPLSDSVWSPTSSAAVAAAATVTEPGGTSQVPTPVLVAAVLSVVAAAFAAGRRKPPSAMPAATATPPQLM